ncbi:MAG: thioesterase [Aquincola sp.]|nr:thioesterase [Aquincola sp.]
MNLPSSPSPWLLRVPPPSPGALRLFCLPHAGSGAAAYAGWASALGPQIELMPVQPPGRETRLQEPPHADMACLVQAMVQAIGPWCRGPYAVFGHSMGAHVAHALVLRLQAEGHELPQLLIASGARAPHLPARRPLLCEMPDAQLAAAIEERYGARFEPELRELLLMTLPTLRADLRVVETREPMALAPLAVPLLVLAGASDASVPLPDARAWEGHTTEHFELKVFPGGHFFPTTQREAVLSCLRRALGRWQGAWA